MRFLLQNKTLRVVPLLRSRISHLRIEDGPVHHFVHFAYSSEERLVFGPFTDLGDAQHLLWTEQARYRACGPKKTLKERING